MIPPKNKAQSLLSELNHDAVKSTNPALVTGAATTTVVAAATLILQFVFPKLPNDVVIATLTIIAVLVPVIQGFITRKQVWSPASVQTVVEETARRALIATGTLHEIKTQTDDDSGIRSPLPPTEE